MGPRNCSYLHFISVIRGSEVIKTPNIPQVKKVLKFKNVEQIYASIDSKCDGSRGKCQNVDRSLATPYGCDEVKSVVKIEATEEDSGPDSYSMTLKQLKKTCKSKKRKTSLSVNLIDVKKEDIDSQPQEDELDLKESLISWKRKLLKTKTKKGMTKGVSLSFTTNSSGGGSKCTPYDKPQEENSWKICEARIISVDDAKFYGNVKTKTLGANEHHVPGQDIETSMGAFESVCLNGGSNEDLSSPVSILVEAQSCGLNEGSYEHLDSDLSRASDDHLSFSVSSSVEAQNCGFDQGAYEHLESDLPMNPFISADLKFEDVEKASETFVTDDQPLDFPVVEQRKEEGMADVMMYDEAVQEQNCVLNQVSYEHPQCVQFQVPLICEDSKIKDAIEVDVEADSGDKSLVSSLSEQACEEWMSVPITCVEAVVQAQNCVGSRVSYEHQGCVQLQNPPVSEHWCKEGIRVLMTCDEAPETVFLECNKSDLEGYNLHHSRVQTPSPEPDMICVNTESTNEDKATGTIDNSKDIETQVTEIVLGDHNSTLESSSTLPSMKNMVSRGNVASAVHVKQSSVHDFASAGLISPPDIQPCDSIDPMTVCSVFESCLDDVPRPPETLFYARKTISPNSQAKLRRVMKSHQMQAFSEIHPCREKLSFEKDGDDKSSSPKSDIRRDRICFTSKRHEAISNINIKPPMKKGKEKTKVSCLRGIPKRPHASQVSQYSSQNAIVFSQQQMNDIERLAQKLVTEVQSMKDIFVDALQCESRTGAKLRYNTDEVRVAVQHATKVENTTRKWLSMMTRDCNRFCNIMRLAEADDGSSSPEKAANHNKRRKIMFADEAGGSLCHVRVFEASDAGGVVCPVKPEIGAEASSAL